MNEHFEIPHNWEVVTLEDVAEGKNAIVDGPFGSNLKTSDYIDDNINGVPVLTTKNLEGDYSDKKVRFISKEKFEELKRSQVNPGDILVAKIGSIGKTGIYPQNARVAIIPANLLKFTVSKKVVFNYVYYYINSRGLQNRIKKISTATAQPAFNVTKFRKLLIPLPPKPTQQAIVSKIEELFSELDKGIENLRLAQQQLKTYRQSVLKWAFEGKYSKSVEKWKKMTMREVSLKIVVGYVGPVTQHIVQSGGVKFLSTTHIGENEFLNHDIREVSNAFNESNKKSQVIPGDIIIARHGDSGKACMIPDSIKIAQISNAVILRPNPEIALPLFICYRLNAERQRMQKMKVGGVFQVVNTKSMESFQTLVPPIEEQHKIIQEIESRLSVADKMGESITQSLQQAEALRQSILKKAFEGRLV